MSSVQSLSPSHGIFKHNLLLLTKDNANGFYSGVSIVFTWQKLKTRLKMTLFSSFYTEKKHRVPVCLAQYEHCEYNLIVFTQLMPWK